MKYKSLRVHSEINSRSNYITPWKYTDSQLVDRDYITYLQPTTAKSNTTFAHHITQPHNTHQSIHQSIPQNISQNIPHNIKHHNIHHIIQPYKQSVPTIAKIAQAQQIKPKEEEKKTTWRHYNKTLGDFRRYVSKSYNGIKRSRTQELKTSKMMSKDIFDKLIFVRKYKLNVKPNVVTLGTQQYNTNLHQQSFYLTQTYSHEKVEAYLNNNRRLFVSKKQSKNIINHQLQKSRDFKMALENQLVLADKRQDEKGAAMRRTLNNYLNCQKNR